MPTKADLKQLLQHREPEDEEFSDTVLEVSVHWRKATKQWVTAYHFSELANFMESVIYMLP